jgi:hypothetical protein
VITTDEPSLRRPVRSKKSTVERYFMTRPPRITIAIALLAFARSNRGGPSFTMRSSATATTGVESASSVKTPSHARERPTLGRRLSIKSPSSARSNGPLGGRTIAESVFFRTKKTIGRLYRMFSRGEMRKRNDYEAIMWGGSDNHELENDIRSI